MIQSFRGREAGRIFSRQRGAKLGAPLQRAALRKLLILDAADTLDDLRVPPGNRLEKLVGDRDGQQSIRINDQWRICFRWEGGDAHGVESWITTEARDADSNNTTDPPRRNPP